ncbi:MAG: dTDP-glucose 4,6-dehydratase [Verrucomicrobiota bacterium]
MNLLVTGGAGFIGSNLIHYLLGDAAPDCALSVNKLINLDKLTYAGNLENLAPIESDPRYTFAHGDIGDPQLVAQLLRDYDIDGILHLAAESHVDRSIENPEEFIETNVVGTFNLLEQFRRYLKELPSAATSVSPAKSSHHHRFLHVSTDEVYGSLGPDDPAFSETTPYSPNSPYSAAKAGSDHLARAYAHTYQLPVITTNCSNNYGPYQFPEKLIPLMIQKVLKGEALPVYGDGSNVRDWLYVKDHCRGLTLAFLNGKIGEVYNIGGNCEMKNIDVVRGVIAAVQKLAPDSAGARKSAEELISFVTDRPGHDHRYAIDCSKISRSLGWSPSEDFHSGLEKTVQWYLDHKSWIQSIESGNYQGQRLGTL